MHMSKMSSHEALSSLAQTLKPNARVPGGTRDSLPDEARTASHQVTRNFALVILRPRMNHAKKLMLGAAMRGTPSALVGTTMRCNRRIARTSHR